MKRRAGWLTAAAVGLCAAGSWAAGDAKVGKELHDAKCLKCHGTDVYTTPQRKIGSLDALKAQVAQCGKAAEAGWTEAQVADVVEYLNGSFYKFP